MHFPSDPEAWGFSRAWGGSEAPVRVWQDWGGGGPWVRLVFHFLVIGESLPLSRRKSLLCTCPSCSLPNRKVIKRRVPHVCKAFGELRVKIILTQAVLVVSISLVVLT